MGKTTKLLSLVLAVALVFALPPITAQAEPVICEIIVTGDTGYSYDSTAHTLTINKSGTYSLSMNGVTQTTRDTIAVYASNGPVNLTLNNLNIDVSSDSSKNAFTTGGMAIVNLSLNGANTLKSGDFAGMRVYVGTALTISGPGSLEVTGSAGIGGDGWGTLNGSNGGKITINSGTVTATGVYGAGIGGGYGGFGGDITINGGTIIATGGNYGAGIGGGDTDSGGIITINGGTVTATGGGVYGGAGIGGGYEGAGGDITINDGMVTAIGVGGGAGIGGGYEGAGGGITINDGTVTAIGGGGGAGIGGGSYAGGNSVKIIGGTVHATGGSSGGAGIGGGSAGLGGGDRGGYSGVVNISDGIVYATGGDGGSGIGSGYNGYCNSVSINGGTVTAQGGYRAAGIGGANKPGGTVLVTGGIVSAIGGYAGAGIGGGYSGAGGETYISGGSVSAQGGEEAQDIGHGSGSTYSGTLKNDVNGVNVYKTTVTLQGINAATAVTALTTSAGYSYGTNGMKTDASGRLYLYLPANARTTAAKTPSTSYIGSITTLNTGTASGTLSIGKTITATVNNTTYGSVTGSGTFAYGTSVTLRATPKAGYRFTRWLEGSATVSTNPAYTFTVTMARTLKAEFAKIGTPTVMAASAGYSSIKISWAVVTGAQGYEVSRYDSATKLFKALVTVTATTYTNTGLTTGATYYYKVRAKCVAGSTTTYGDNSATASAKPVLATPASVKAASASCNSIKLTWGVVADATKYEIYRVTSDGGNYTKLVETTSTSYIVTGLTTNTTYYYKVRAKRLTGSTTIYSLFSTIVSAKPVLATPADVTAASHSYNSIGLSWNEVDGATIYEVYSVTADGGNYTKLAEYVCTLCEVTGLTTNTTYYYKVRAKCVTGNAIIYSYFSPIVSAKPVPARQFGVTAVRASATSAKVSWDPVDGATGYEVHRATDIDGPYLYVTSTSSLSWTNAGLVTGKTYYYRVRAYRLVDGARVYGEFSRAASATP